MSFYTSVFPSIHIFTSLFFYLYVCPCVHLLLNVFLSIHLSFSIFVCMFFVHVSTCPLFCMKNSYNTKILYFIKHLLFNSAKFFYCVISMTVACLKCILCNHGSTNKFLSMSISVLYFALNNLIFLVSENSFWSTESLSKDIYYVARKSQTK
jgi:hypothetical protein